MLVSIANLVIALVPEQRSSRHFKESPVLCLLVDDNIILPRDLQTHTKKAVLCFSAHRQSFSPSHRII